MELPQLLGLLLAPALLLLWAELLAALDWLAGRVAEAQAEAEAEPLAASSGEAEAEAEAMLLLQLLPLVLALPERLRLPLGLSEEEAEKEAGPLGVPLRLPLGEEEPERVPLSELLEQGEARLLPEKLWLTEADTVLQLLPEADSEAEAGPEEAEASRLPLSEPLLLPEGQPVEEPRPERELL